MKSHKYYSFIDGLRALAVVAVFLYHLNPRLMPSGFAGVDLFFVISGFVVTASVMNFRGTLPQFLAFFYSRRVLRIMPALLVVLLLTSLLCTLFVPPAWLSSSNRDSAFYAHIGLSNWFFAKESTNYFSPLADYNPYTHTWSLGVEEQFYFLFPWLIFPILLHRKWRIPGILVIGVISIASLIWGLRDAGSVWTFFGLHTRFWQLGLGVLAYFFTTSRAAESTKILRGWLSYVGLALIVSGLLFTRAEAFPDLWNIILCLGGVLVIVVLANDKTQSSTRRILSSPPMREVGHLSYSLYLVHWPVIVLFRWTIGCTTWWQILMAASVSIALTYCLNIAVENRFRSLQQTFRMQRPAIIAVGLLCVWISFETSKHLFRNQSSLALSTVVRDHQSWQTDNYRLPDVACAVEITQGQHGSRIYRARNECKKSASKKLFVVGDSHSGAYHPLYLLLASKTGIEVELYSSAGCPVLYLVTSLSSQSANCRNFVLDSIKYVAFKNTKVRKTLQYGPG